MPESTSDIWSQWVLGRRFGGDSKRMQAMLERLYPVRDLVLRRLNLREGETLLDVGCGDGLIAFGALEKFAACRVIFSDISQDLLQQAESLARGMGLLDRCQFLRASAEEPSALIAESVDAVTTRSVLIYVSAKQQAFDEFYRVLRPGKRLSIFEPINRFGWPEPPDRFTGYDVTPVMHLAAKLKAVYLALQSPDSDPMTDFDERDLLAYAEKAGFAEVHLDLEAEITPPEEGDWEALMHTAGNPSIPTIEEALQQALSYAEAETFVYHLRPLVEARRGVRRSAVAYLWAVK